ncbi:FadR/GntR family transcriptional regulator [Aquincola tertiaricarbonis]|uniref:FadR/GntR family transcriptional regulator n=1 Tax=Aquincola tertiaricarbonis TaxID=391953 RepID=UPI000698DC41|nr:GntR family transcriptional regulator [Aquincola tertiaricarbonis]
MTGGASGELAMLGADKRRPQAIYQALTGRIADGRLRAGCRLTERHLAEEFNASRTVVREALVKLQARGLAYTRQGAGTVVLEPVEYPERCCPEPSDTSITGSWLEVRLGLETEAAALAARRRTAADLQRLDAAARRRPGSWGGNHHFHLAVAQAAHNRLYLNLLRSTLAAHEAEWPEESGGRKPPSTGHGDLYIAIVQAIRAGDSVAASACMRLLLNAQRSTLCEEDQPPSAQ